LHKQSIGLGINYVILSNHLVSLITSSTTDSETIPDIAIKLKSYTLYI